MLMRRELRVALGALAAGALAVVAIAKVFGPGSQPGAVEMSGDARVPIAAQTAGPVNTDSTGFQRTFDAAMKGDYQAQRNLAYGYTSAPYAGQTMDPVHGCAWRIVILHSGHASVDQTDVNNHHVYCSKLDAAQAAAAQAQGRQLFTTIYGKPATF